MTDKGKLHMDWHRHKRDEIRSNSSSVNLEEIYSEDRQMRVNKKGELVYLTFPILEETGMVKHLFSTRMGGVSEGIYRSMNLSYTRGDRKEAVDENFRRIAAALSCSVEAI